RSRHKRSRGGLPHGGGGSVASTLRRIALARNYGHPVTSCGVQVFYSYGIVLFAAQGKHEVRAVCTSRRQRGRYQRQQQHGHGGKRKHARIERAYVEQKRTQQLRC